MPVKLLDEKIIDALRVPEWADAYPWWRDDAYPPTYHLSGALSRAMGLDESPVVYVYRGVALDSLRQCRCCGARVRKGEECFILGLWESEWSVAKRVALLHRACEWGAAYEGRNFRAHPGPSPAAKAGLVRAAVKRRKQHRETEEERREREDFESRCGPVTVRRVDPSTLR